MSIIAIRPYVEKSIFNMGLEKHNQSIFEGTKYSMEMACYKRGDTWIYETGLDEAAPRILDITSQDERDAKIKQIREVVVRVERQLGGYDIKATDKDFWSKVIKLRATNVSFWSTIKIECSNEPKQLDPTNAIDLLKIIAIEAGGFPEIAKSLDEARSKGIPPKFYLDKLEASVSTDIIGPMVRNRAGAILQDLYDNNINKLNLVCKVIDPNSPQYKKSTPTGVLYRNMNAYIDGLTVDTDKKQTAQKFIDVSLLDMETLKLRALVKDAHYYRLMITRGDGLIYDIETSSALGHNVEEVVQYFKNPLHEEIMQRVLKKVEKYWNE